MSKFRILSVLFGFSFLVSSSFAAFDTSVNLIESNPGFEDGSSGWNTGVGVIDDTDASEGTQSVSLTSTGSGDNGDWRSDGYYNITPGLQYQFTFDYKTSADSTGNPQVRFRFFDSSGSFKTEGQQTLDLTDGEWQSVVIECTCPDDSAYFDIFYSVSTFGTFEGTAWLDNTAVNPWVSDDITRNPTPEDEETDVAVDQVLSWDRPFNDPNGYTLYLVEGADPNWAEVSPVWSTTDPNETSYTPAEEFTMDTTYSWRVDANAAGDTWTFTTVPPIAINPDPADDETGVSTLYTCSWGAVPGALSYDVYWGTDEDLVTNGDDSVYQGTQTGTSFTPEMEFTTQYFWRIDTNLDSGLSVGDVWDYTTADRICDPEMAGDTNNDCVVDMEDLANVAADWLRCTLTNGLCP